MRASKVLISFAFLFALVSGPGAAATLDESCDGVAGVQCDTGLWCDHPAGQCNVADAAGQCVKAPDVCTQDYNPVCGCDGETYGNDCMRKLAKVQLDHIGECGN